MAGVGGGELRANEAVADKREPALDAELREIARQLRLIAPDAIRPPTAAKPMASAPPKRPPRPSGQPLRTKSLLRFILGFVAQGLVLMLVVYVASIIH